MQTFRSFRTALLLWAFVFSTAATQANYADFNGNGTPDLLFMNKTTRKLEVWFDNTFMGAGSLNSQPITQNGSPWTVSEGWKLVGVGKFNPANTNQLGILLQHQPPASRAMVVWFLKTTNPTEIDSAGNVQYASPNREAAAVGDFNGDGKSDIAFRYDLDRLNAIWLMNGLNLGSGAVTPTAVITGASPEPATSAAAPTRPAASRTARTICCSLTTIPPATRLA